MRKEFFIENYSCKTFTSKNGHAMVLIKMSDIKGDFNLVIPASYLAKIISSHHANDTQAQHNQITRRVAR